MVIQAALIALALIAPPRAANAHPLHSTITELSENRANGAVRATIRVFADDFGTAVTRSLRGRAIPAGEAWNAAATAYLTSTFTLADRAGRSIALRSCGIRRTADMFLVCIETVAATNPTALTVSNRVLCDVWDDQVNVVQATINGSRRSLLFTKGDTSKPLM